MAKQMRIENWGFMQVPEVDKKGRIVALVGYVDGVFLGGSSRIVAYDDLTNIATAESGTEYTLGSNDPHYTVDGLKAVIKKYTRSKNAS